MKTLERSTSPMLAYTNCCERYLPTEEELSRQCKTPLSYMPLISIVVPAYETAEAFLRALLDSVQGQTYPNWELCIADGSRRGNVASVVRQYQKKDSRIRYTSLSHNGGISANTNAGFGMVSGEYIAMMDHDDILTRNALYEMVQCLIKDYSEAERQYALIYSDEDKIDGEGKVHSRPHFKPDYNPEYLRRNNYFCHFLMFHSFLLEETKGLRREYDGAQDYDFVLRCVEAKAVVRHVPKILYHWRIHEGSTAGNSADKAYAFEAGCLAIEGHLNRIGEPGTAQTTKNLGVYQVTYVLEGTYRITVVTEKQEELKRIREHYKKAPCGGENGKYHFDIHYMLADQINDAVIKECIGDYVLFISKETHPKTENLIEGLLGICQHTSVGMVSAKLYKRNNRVASCGIIYNEKGALVQSQASIPGEYKGYFLHAVIPQNVSAVSLSCVMIKRVAYDACGGMNEEFSGLFRDADICFSMRKAGHQIIETPEVSATVDELSLYENPTGTAFTEKWKEILCQKDPCYNPNLSDEPGHTYAMKE